MGLNSTTLAAEVDSILGGPINQIRVEWQPEMQIDGELVEIHKILSLEVSRDFDNSFGDSTILECVFTNGVYNSDILPNKDKLWCQLNKEYKKPAELEDGKPGTLPKSEVWTYRAVLIPESNEALTGIDGADDKETGDISGTTTVRFQLMQPLLEYIKTVTVGGIFNDTPSGDIIRYLLDRESKVAGAAINQVCKGTDLYPMTESQPRVNTIIRHGTNLMEVPDYIQQFCGGVYSSGIGYYLLRDKWYVYPKYDINKFTDSRRTLTIINVPKNKMNGVDKSFKVENDGLNITVLAAGDVDWSDPGEELVLNDGNGLQYVDASRMMEYTTTTPDNKCHVVRGDNVHEYVGVKKASGLNHSPLSPRRITSNDIYELSTLASRAGQYITVEWQHAQPDLIIPGMGVCFYYTLNGKIVTLHGTVLGMQSIYALESGGMTARQHSSQAAITMFLTEV